MHELVTVGTFQRWLLAGAAVWLVGWLLVAAVRRKSGGAAGSVLWALMGPVAVGLWKYYLWTVRVDPQTGYVGLHKVSVFALNALVFVVCGCFVGWLLSRLHNNGGKSEG